MRVRNVRVLSPHLDAQRLHEALRLLGLVVHHAPARAARAVPVLSASAKEAVAEVQPEVTVALVVLGEGHAGPVLGVLGDVELFFNGG